MPVWAATLSCKVICLCCCLVNGSWLCLCNSSLHIAKGLGLGCLLRRCSSLFSVLTDTFDGYLRDNSSGDPKFYRIKKVQDTGETWCFRSEIWWCSARNKLYVRICSQLFTGFCAMWWRSTNRNDCKFLKHALALAWSLLNSQSTCPLKHWRTRLKDIFYQFTLQTMLRFVMEISVLRLFCVSSCFLHRWVLKT